MTRTRSESMYARHTVEQHLKRLRMPGMLLNLNERLEQAREGGLGHLEFLSLLVQDEILSREANNLRKRLKAAGFGLEKTFEGFDFRFNDDALPSSTLRDLASVHFIEQRRNIVLAGPAGIAVRALTFFSSSSSVACGVLAALSAWIEPPGKGLESYSL
jgi:DNA replication protein DnaC